MMCKILAAPGMSWDIPVVAKRFSGSDGRSFCRGPWGKKQCEKKDHKCFWQGTGRIEAEEKKARTTDAARVRHASGQEFPSSVSN